MVNIFYVDVCVFVCYYLLWIELLPISDSDGILISFKWPEQLINSRQAALKSRRRSTDRPNDRKKKICQNANHKSINKSASWFFYLLCYPPATISCPLCFLLLFGFVFWVECCTPFLGSVFNCCGFSFFMRFDFSYLFLHN